MSLARVVVLSSQNRYGVAPLCCFCLTFPSLSPDIPALPPPAAIFTSIHTYATFTTPTGSLRFLVGAVPSASWETYKRESVESETGYACGARR